jgi:EAL domain-containing protein (putative c-di-GMP-specific phosphodiesterase class I)
MSLLRAPVTATTPLIRPADIPASEPIQERRAMRELGRYMPRTLAAALLVAASEVLAGTMLSEPALLGAAALSAVFGIVVVGAGYLIHIGRDRWIAPLLAASVSLLGLLGAFLIPGAAAASAMLPIFSVVLLLPGRDRRSVAAILIVALAGSGLALVLGGAAHPFPPLREPLGSIFTSATLLGVALLIMGALTDFAIQASESFDRMRRTLLAQTVSSAERTAILASIGKLERKDTLAATAAVIVDELIKLPHIDIAGVFACDDHDLEVLALVAPIGFPIKVGDQLPAARAQHLLERSSSGPWAERWTGDPSLGSYGEAFTATGIKALAYAPFFDGGRRIGIIGIGTQSDAHADHLVADLPAVAEFAATTSVLLAPMLVARQAIIETRRSVQRIMATKTFRPVFQPVVELASGRIVGFEALTRFADGRRPDLVFGAAGDAGLGLELELATLEAALHAARQLPTGTWLSLNASPGLIVEATGLARVLATRDRPVVLEITEHVVIDDYRAVRSAIDRLGADVRVAVDDAGAGIANFSHLAELRPHLVKVDGGLIRDLDTDLARQAVVVGFVHFAAKAGCDVIAEGIETAAERSMARSLGVTLGQGYLFARPASATEFIDATPMMPVAFSLPRIGSGPELLA